MKKLKQGATVALLGTGGGQNKKVYNFLRTLEVGDSAIIDREDWEGDTQLSHTIHNISSFRGRYSCKLVVDRSGWFVKRIK